MNILSNKTAKGLVDYVKKALKEDWGYVLGTYGQILTPAVLRAKQNQGYGVGAYNRRHNTYVRKYLNKRVSDCYGLVKGFLWTDKNGKVTYDGRMDRNQEMAYNAAKEKGTIANIPEIPGLVLWMKGHAGIYIGNGEFIEIAGVPVGMRKGKITNGKVTRGSKFTHWFKDTFIDYGKGGITIPPNKQPVKPVMKWYGIGSPHNEIAPVQELQKNLEALGYSVGSWGTNGVMGKDTAGAIGKFQKDHGLVVDNQAGIKTLAKIETALNTKPTHNIWYGIGSPHNNKSGVQQLQKDLVKLGYSVGSWGTNGVMGKDTANAIGRFQKANNLVVDKQAGIKTLTKIQESLNAKPSKYMKVKPIQGANVRTGAGAGFNKAMNALKQGTTVQVIGESSNWYNIIYGGITGYIRKDLLQ